MNYKKPDSWSIFAFFKSICSKYQRICSIPCAIHRMHRNTHKIKQFNYGCKSRAQP